MKSYHLAPLLLLWTSSFGQVDQAAVTMTLDEKWDFHSGLSEKAFLISIQGLANRESPELYFVYPDDWPYSFTGPFQEWLVDEYGFAFQNLDSPDAVFETFKDRVHGYVVWDEDIRASLMVSFTLAGLEDAVVVSGPQIQLLEAAGIPLIHDFRGQFAGQSDVEIFQWAYEQYWSRVDQGFLVYLGGRWRDGMQPGVADMAVAKRAFATDLSVDPADSAEYALSNRIFEEMEPWSFVLGWHSYLKDTEAQHITQMSRHTLRQEGLNTFPNMSFLNHLRLADGYRFENHHNIESDAELTPEAKVYITCVQTDGLGLGAWFRPGRGDIPYAWEVADGISMELFPVLLQFYYETASDKDYFIGALSGPNYMYPKAIPKDRLPEVVERAREQMELMDLRVFGIMDYTEGNRYYGNIDLPKSIVDEYYRGMSQTAIGFINGYGPAHTNDFRDGVPLISYDYYLSPTRPEKDATADLEELIGMNPERPYFLAMHVRESSDVDRVKRILDDLGPDIEVVPMDVFMKLAAARPTFRTWFLPE